jgi:preprotein translocase subunit SecG
MFSLVIALHVLICALLILLVLVQQGRGGGLIDSFSSAESIFGTKTNTFLVKATSVLATAFFLTCLSLAFLSLQKGKSLMETSYRPPVEGSTEQAMPQAAGEAVPAAAAAASETPVEPTVPAAAAPTQTQEAPPPTEPPSTATGDAQDANS